MTLLWFEIFSAGEETKQNLIFIGSQKNLFMQSDCNSLA